MYRNVPWCLVVLELSWTWISLGTCMSDPLNSLELFNLQHKLCSQLEYVQYMVLICSDFVRSEHHSHATFAFTNHKLPGCNSAFVIAHRCIACCGGSPVRWIYSGTDHHFFIQCINTVVNTCCETGMTLGHGHTTLTAILFQSDIAKAC